MGNKERPSPEPERDWTVFDGPVLPEDPDNFDQYMGAKRCYWELHRIVSNTREHDIPLTPTHIKEYFQAMHTDWMERRQKLHEQSQSQDYTLTHVLACAKRDVLDLEQDNAPPDQVIAASLSDVFQLEGAKDPAEYHRVAVATRELIKKALALKKKA